MTISPHALSLAIAVPVIVLLYYRRIRRQFGRQPVHIKRMMIRIVILALVGALMLFGSLMNPMALAADLAGLVIGIALGWWGLRLTRFENENDGVHYIPHGFFGIAISVLLIARLVYRFVVLSPAMGQTAQQISYGGSPFAMYQRSPLTLALFGLLVGYYVAYYAGVLLTARRMAPTATDV